MLSKKAVSNDAEKFFGVLKRNIEVQRSNWINLDDFSKANCTPQAQTVVRNNDGPAEMDLLEKRVRDCNGDISYYATLSEEFLKHLECFTKLISLCDFTGFTPLALEEFEQPVGTEEG